MSMSEKEISKLYIRDENWKNKVAHQTVETEGCSFKNSNEELRETK